MLGFSSFSELPLSTIPRTPVVKLSEIPVEVLSSLFINKTLPIESLLGILGNRNIPIEIRSNLVSVIFDLPIEIVGSKTTPEGLKWVLNSRGTTWQISTELLELVWKIGGSDNNDTWRVK